MPSSDSYRQSDLSGDRFCCAPLPEAEKRLADRFYSAHGSRMKVRPAHTAWALRSDRILACLCLQPVAHGYWLTSLFVEPDSRRTGLAGTLVSAACATIDGPIWLFCHPDLEALYHKQGFVRTPSLPEPLVAKLRRYQQTKELIAMCRGQ